MWQKNKITIYDLWCRFWKHPSTEDNGKQNPEAWESYMNKYQKHTACSYSCKLVCVDDKFSKTFRSYLGKGAVFNFINSIVEENKYFSVVVKKILTKNL